MEKMLDSDGKPKPINGSVDSSRSDDQPKQVDDSFSLDKKSSPANESKQLYDRVRGMIILHSQQDMMSI